MRYLYILQTIV